MREYRPNPIRPFAFTALFLLAIAAVAAGLSGCNHEDIDPIEPEATCAVSDACVPEVVEEFCVEPEVCDPEAGRDLAFEEGFYAGHIAGYFDGFGDAAAICVRGTLDACWRGQYVCRFHGRDYKCIWEYVRYECGR